MRTSKKFYVTLALACTLAFTGCSDQGGQKAEAPAEKQETTAQAPAPTQPAGHPETMMTAAQEQETIDGTILETFDSGGYTYLNLETDHGPVWAAIGQAKVTLGDEISLLGGPVMRDFHSRTLDRTFTEIIFSSGIKGDIDTIPPHAAEASANPHGEGVEEGEAAASFAEALQAEGSTAPVMDVGSDAISGGSGKAVSPLQEITVVKAEGENGFTVAEVFSTAGDLAGKKVKVRGKAVKVSPNIMGRTWIHLQDGTGDPMNNSHDLVVTSDAVPEKDSIILVEGVLAKDKDFGAGYFYNVILEEATVSN